MNKQVLALQPQLAVEAEAHEAPQLQAAEIWNQEQEVHARFHPERPEVHQEQLRQVLLAMDYQRLLL